MRMFPPSSGNGVYFRVKADLSAFANLVTESAGEASSADTDGPWNINMSQTLSFLLSAR
ncbi:hypothetical protein J2X24_001319 [Asticcacaulis solisilvae]|nr:hypothetical protein [Asticcacaulis solisilvae]MDR6799802.1 hypothetical protein [Asticcacaulis sp. BE141]